jgi:purine-binding chemotaxis protein CheW
VKEFVTVTIAGQRFGIPVLSVQDVLTEQRLTHIPLAPPEIAGALNLRGRTVTAIDIRIRLGLEPREKGASCMNVVVEYEGEPFSLMVDTVGDVLALSDDEYEANPITLDPVWREIADGLYRLEEGLLIVFDVSRLFDEAATEAA